MANYENIKPYADFAHTAAQHKGVENYLKELTDSSYKLGVMDERSTECRKGFILAAGVLIVWEAGKAAIRGIKSWYNCRKARQAELIHQYMKAKAAILADPPANHVAEDNDENDLDDEA